MSIEVDAFVYVLVSFRLLSFYFGGPKLIRFLAKTNCSILWIDLMSSRQKLGIILVNKMFENWNYRKCFHSKMFSLIFLNENKIKKIPLVFDRAVFTKYNNFLWVCWFLAKNLTNFDPSKSELNNLTDTIYINVCVCNVSIAMIKWVWVCGVYISLMCTYVGIVLV